MGDAAFICIECKRAFEQQGRQTMCLECIRDVARRERDEARVALARVEADRDALRAMHDIAMKELRLAKAGRP